MSLISLGFVLGLQGQEGQLSGPVSGHLFDLPSRSIRPVVGVLGGAHLGAPVVSEVDFASVAPNGRLALAVQENRVRIVRDLHTQSPVSSSPENLLEAPARIVWSGDSSVAVMYSQESNQTQRLEFGDGNISAAPPVSLASLPGTLCSLAVSVRSTVLGMCQDGVYLLDAAGSLVRLASVVEPVALAFGGDGDSVYVADQQTRQILRIQGLAGGAEMVPWLQDLDGAGEPVGLAFSPDGRFLYMADAARNTLRVYENATRRQVSELSLEAAPSQIQPLNATSFLLKSRRSGGDMILVLETRAEPTVLFLPAGE